MNYSENQMKTQFQNAITFINNLNDPWNILKNQNNVLKNLETINDINLKTEFTLDWISDEKKVKFIEIIIDYLKYSYENIKENIQSYNLIIKPETQSLVDCSGVVAAHHECKMYTLLEFSLIMWHWADKSIYFCYKFHDLNGLKILFKYISDSLLIFHLIEKFKLQTLRKHQKSYFHLALTIKSLVGTIHNLSKFENSYRLQWSDLNAFQHLLNLSKLFSDESNKLCNLDIDLLAYFALIYLAKTFNDLSSLNELNRYVTKVLGLLEQCGSWLATHNTLSVERKLFKLNDKPEPKEIAIIHSKENTQWRLTELINFMIRVCDLSTGEYKRQTFENFGNLKLNIKQILFFGNEIEKEYILKLVWKLCINNELTRAFQEDSDLNTFLMGLTCNKLFQNKEILKYCDHILFLFESVRVNCTNGTGPAISAMHVIKIHSNCSKNASEINIKKMNF